MSIQIYLVSCIYHISYTLGRRGRNQRHRHNQRLFDLSFVHSVYFVHNSTEFHVMQMEFQRILIHLLPLISHESYEIEKRCHFLSPPSLY